MERKWILLPIAFAVYFLAHAVPKSSEPLKVFEWEYFSAAAATVSGGVPVEYGTREAAVEHPPLYVHLIGLAMKIGGIEVRTARLAGIVFAFAALAVLFPLCSSLGGGAAAFAAAAAFFLSSPALIQGSTVIGAADTGLFLPLLPLFFLAELGFRRRRTLAAWSVFAALFCLCLWSKFTTSLVLPLFFLGWRALRRDKTGFLQEGAGFAAGVLLFTASWGVYSYFVVGMEYFNWPFTYPFPQVTAGMPSGGILFKILGGAAELARTSVWFPPFLLTAAAAAFPGGDGSEEESGRGVLLLGTLVFLGYVAVRGTAAGFPKYQLPALLLFCGVVGVRLAAELSVLRFRARIGLAALAASAYVYGIAVVGDVVLQVQHLVNSASVNGAGAVAPGALALLAVYFTPFAAAIAGARLAGWNVRQAVFLVSVCFALGYGLSLNTIQLRAPYSTSYAYGTSGAAEAAAFLRTHTLPDDAVAGAFETLYAAGNRRALRMPEKAWNSKEAFLEFAAEAKPAALVVGLGTNTAAQQARVFDSPAVRDFLKAGYEEHVFGSYTVWLGRRNGK